MHAWIAFAAGILIAVGALLLFAAFSGITYYGLNAQIMVAMAVMLLVAAAISAWLLYAAVRAQYSRVKTGKEALIGASGIAVTNLNPKGEIRVMGEFWQATAKEAAIANGQEVEVVGMEGMFLVVIPLKEKA